MGQCWGCRACGSHLSTKAVSQAVDVWSGLSIPSLHVAQIPRDVRVGIATGMSDEVCRTVVELGWGPHPITVLVQFIDSNWLTSLGS